MLVLHSRLQVKKICPPRTQNLKPVPRVGLNSNLCYTFYAVGISMLRSYCKKDSKKREIFQGHRYQKPRRPADPSVKTCQ